MGGKKLYTVSTCMAYYICPRTFSFHLLGSNMYECHYYDMPPIWTHIHTQRANIQKCGSHTVLALKQLPICPKFATATICYPLHITVVLVHSTVMKHLPNIRFQNFILGKCEQAPQFTQKRTEIYIKFNQTYCTSVPSLTTLWPSLHRVYQLSDTIIPTMMKHTTS